MNTIKSMSKSARCAFGAAVLVAIPTNAIASDEATDIVVQSNAAMKEWKEDVTHDLNRALARSSVARKMTPNASIVQVTFEIGEDGKPTNIELYNDEGNYSARKTAVYAVSRLRDLDTVPVSGDRSELQFLANIIFADSRADEERLAARLEASEQERIASTGVERTYIALNF